MKYPDRTWPSLIYWGKYVAHDNNRDAMGVTLKLTENVLNTYVDWKAQVLHDLHESVPYLYDNTIGDGPYNAWVDPLLTNEWHMIGWNNVQEMTRLGMPGVFAFGAFDTWSPGYLMFIAATHNGISRLYETFGNGGSAETLERTLSESQTSRTWYRQNPPLPRVKWSLRNNNNYEQTGVLVSLNYFATNKRLFLQNFYEKSKRSILKAKTEGPAAYVLPANDPRPGAQAELLRDDAEAARRDLARDGAVHRAGARVARRAGRCSGRGEGGHVRTDSTLGATDSAAHESRARSRGVPRRDLHHPDGPAVFAHCGCAARLPVLGPNDPQTNPYDDTGWTFPEAFATTGRTRHGHHSAQRAGRAVTGVDRRTGRRDRQRQRLPDQCQRGQRADNAALSLQRCRLPGRGRAVRMPAARSSHRGSFIIRGVAQADLDRGDARAGAEGVAVSLGADCARRTRCAPRAIAIMHTWASTQTEGWWRLALRPTCRSRSSTSARRKRRAIANLRAKYDVILFPPGGGNAAGNRPGHADVAQPDAVEEFARNA